MPSADLKSVETHFRFGENWASFATLLSPARIEFAEKSLRDLVGDSLQGKSFLDIGSGSGLSALAAARLGADPIVACDIDPDSVRTTTEVLKAHSPSQNFVARLASVFDLRPDELGQFDVVHSWGVLHHTGSMWEAIGKAAALVKPGGMFVIALYRKTPRCGFWRVEKRFYAGAPQPVQSLLFRLYRATAKAYMLARGLNPAKEWGAYESRRGMDQDHDIRDWLGGYPYESASPEEIENFLRPLEFTLAASFGTAPRSGWMGTGCAEYVYRKRA